MTTQGKETRVRCCTTLPCPIEPSGDTIFCFGAAALVHDATAWERHSQHFQLCLRVKRKDSSAPYCETESFPDPRHSDEKFVVPIEAC